MSTGSRLPASGVVQRLRDRNRRRLTEEMSQAALEASPCPYIGLDDQCVVTAWNAAAEQVFGWRREEVLRRPLVELIVPDSSREERRAALEGQLGMPDRRTSRRRMQVRGLRRSGQEFPMELSVCRTDHRGRPALHLFITDLSERHREDEARRELLSRLTHAQRIAHVGSWTWDPPAGGATWSPEMFRIFGRDESQGAPLAEDFFAYVCDEDRHSVRAHFRRLSDGGQQVELDYRIRAGDGQERIVHAVALPDPDRPGSFVGTTQDVTELRGVERAALEAEERFRAMFEHAPIGKTLMSIEGDVDQANHAFAAVCGRPVGALTGLALRDLLHPADAAAVMGELQALVRGDVEQVELDARCLTPAGESVPVEIHGRLLRDSAGRPANLLCQFQDISDRKRFESQLRFMADHDPLTGLVNRRRFEIELERHVRQVKRYGPVGALLLLDIDRFKDVNDSFGHTAGDELIASIASLLRGRMRDSDIIARLGGDEFAVLLPHADAESGERVAEALVQAVRVSTTMLGGVPCRVTSSVGLTTFEAPSHLLSAEEVLVEADLAMYEAKEGGRDRYARYRATTGLLTGPRTGLSWMAKIETALQEDRFTLAAQPVLDLQTRRIRQHELLVRLLDERDELVQPSTFLYIAERFGLISRIDEWVSTRAIEILERHPDLTLEVNISNRSLADPRLAERIEERIREGGVDPSRLIFEITESGAMANVAQARAFATRLRNAGCRFALDDFGAGFGSFYYLKHIPFDLIKIDGEFVQHAASGHIDQLVIEAVVRIAQGLGKETVAEFVTDERTQRMVTGLGVDYAQGFHVGTPIPLAELLQSGSGDEALAVDPA